MNRIRLGKILTKCREMSGVHKNVFSDVLGWRLSEYLRYERGSSNLKLQGYVDYLNVVGFEMCLDDTIIDSALTFSTVFIGRMPLRITKAGFASLTGLNLSALDLFTKTPYKISIDAFLTCCRVSGCVLSVRQKGVTQNVVFEKAFNSVKPFSVVSRSLFGKWLEAIRKKNKVPIKDFAFQNNWEENIYRRYEKGIYNFKIQGALQFLKTAKGVLLLDGVVINENSDALKCILSKAKKLSSTALAKKTGLSEQTVCNVKACKTELTIDTLLAYCRVLDIKIEIRPKETVTLVGGNGTNINE